jgi:adenylosuccinate lyase
VLRNLSVALGHTVVSLDSCLRGLSKLDADPATIAADLDGHWEVLAEAVQTVMRRYGLADAYEQLKDLTRGRAVDRSALRKFIARLEIPSDARDRLLELTPSTYTGLAADLARDV